MAFLNKTKLKRKAEAASVPAHPLLKKRELSSDEKTAYLQGCVLATLVDDGTVSDKERDSVRLIGLSLGLQDDEIDEAFSHVEGMKADQDKERLVDEIVSLLKEDPLRESFIGDFERVAMSGGSMQGDAAEIFDLIGARMYKDGEWQRNRAKERANVAAAKSLKALEEDLVHLVERRMTWPAAYDKDSIFALMGRRGIKEHQVIKLLELLLPHARQAYAEVCKNLGRMDHYVSYDRHYLSLKEDKNVLRFLNYVKCMNDCAFLDPDYSIIVGCSGEETLRRDFDYYWVSLEEVNYSHRRSGAAQEARKELRKLYKSLLDEFENMANF